MNHSERLVTFVALGQHLAALHPDELTALADRARNQNAWFDGPNVAAAVAGVAHLLAPGALARWAARYPPEPAATRRVGVVMAGNIPLVGFHDALCVLLSGHILMAKLSASDTVLMQWVLDELVRIEPRFAEFIQVVLRLNAADASAHHNLGNVLLATRRSAEAAAHYEAALRLRPDFAESRKNLDRARRAAASP